MRTKRYLPRIQNGSVAKRQVRSKTPATSRAFIAQKSDARSRTRMRTNQIGVGSTAEGTGSNVMWVMILVGIGLSAVFVFAVRSQINAYKLGQAEEQLKEKLDQYATQQKFLTLDQQRAMNTSESDRAGRAGGLNQLKLDQESAMHAPSSAKTGHQFSDLVKQDPVKQDKDPIGQSADSDRQTQTDQKDNEQEASRSVKQQSKQNLNAPSQNPKAAAKFAGTAKTAKVMKVVKIVKPNAARSNVTKAAVSRTSVPKAGLASTHLKTGTLKAKKQNDNQRQAARSHPKR